MKKINQIFRNSRTHWVGDGFPVRTIFNYTQAPQELSPFLMLDYAAPQDFSPTKSKLGVGEHPHRGFETVTIVYSGEVEHRDSHGGGGIIKSGDVQWMTAASGLVHEEFHSKKFAEEGGKLEMVQLWVNLPKEFKMTHPRYQGIKNAQIPTITLQNDQGSVRIIAGEYQNTKGPAKTFSPVNLWDIRLKANAVFETKVIEGYTTSVFVLNGEIKFPTGEIIHPGEMALLSPQGEHLTFNALMDSKVLFLGGEPINGPVVGHGPFVMNTKAEIDQAISDYQNGLMGRL